MNSQDTFLALIRLGIGNCSVSKQINVDWISVKAVAIQQGLSAVVLDSIESLPESQKPPKYLLLEWIGEVLRQYEQRYEIYRGTIAEMAAFYNNHGYKMMVLKGYACCIDWPKPEHRPCGDIDIWQFGKQKEADEVVASEKGIKIDSSHHHHTVFKWGCFMVENHYDFINTHTHKSNNSLDSFFKELGKDDSYFTVLFGEKIYLPSPNLRALLLIRHAVSHFTTSSVSLRQILDWAFFVKAHSHEVDWGWLINVLEQYHINEFFNCINAICVEELGFSSEFFPSVHYLKGMKDQVLEDILNPKYMAVEPSRLIPRLFYKYRRWKANEWKRKICYEENTWYSFGAGLWSHIIKPSSI